MKPPRVMTWARWDKAGKLIDAEWGTLALPIEDLPEPPAPPRVMRPRPRCAPPPSTLL